MSILPQGLLFLDIQACVFLLVDLHNAEELRVQSGEYHLLPTQKSTCQRDYGLSGANSDWKQHPIIHCPVYARGVVRGLSLDPFILPGHSDWF